MEAEGGEEGGEEGGIVGLGFARVGGEEGCEKKNCLKVNFD
jgi:hypothetical protein